MREIQLSQGKIALVDDEDFDWLNQWKWCARRQRNGNFYAVRNTRKGEADKNSTVLMHRYVLGLSDPKLVTDHIDEDTLNNQKYNLRVTSYSQNAMNRGAQIRGTSKYKGVSWSKPRRKWVAQIGVEHETLYLGLFNSEEEAALAYNKAVPLYHGKFGKLNTIQ